MSDPFPPHPLALMSPLPAFQPMRHQAPDDGQLDELDQDQDPQESQPESQQASQPRPPDPRPADSDPDTPTPTSSTGSERRKRIRDRISRGMGSGDPETVAEILGGLLIAGIGTLGLWLARHGRHLRIPTPDQRDAIAEPVARIACRHLPMARLGPDIADGAIAVFATQDYLMCERLIVRAAVDEQVPE